jgi:hypothetical protein
MIVGFMLTFDFIELEIRQLASVLCNIRKARSRSFSWQIVTAGSRATSVIKNLPSICSKNPVDLQSNDLNSSLEFSAMARKVVIKQLLTAAVNKCSGDQIPGMPFGN